MSHMKELNSYSYEEILKTRDIYNSLLKRFNIEAAVSKHNRIYQAYRILEDILPIYKNSEALNSYLEKKDMKIKIQAVLAELVELRFIFTNLKDMQNPVLAQKIINMSSGHLNPFDESPTNSDARNIQFELALLCDFISQGIEADLGNENPDLTIVLDGTLYNIECKRISSPKKFKSNFKKARNQLDQLLKADKSKNGVIAISMSRMIHDVDMALMPQAPTREQEYKDNIDRYMIKSMNNFIFSNQSIWIDDKKLSSMNIPVIIFHYQAILYGKLKSTGATSIRTITNANSDANDYDDFMEKMRKTSVNVHS